MQGILDDEFSNTLLENLDESKAAKSLTIDFSELKITFEHDMMKYMDEVFMSVDPIPFASNLFA